MEFPRTPNRTAKVIATFKETTNCKIPQAVGAISGVLQQKARILN